MAKIIKGKNPSKPHTVRYWHEGRQRERSFVTRREAQDFIAKFEHDRRLNIFTDPRAASETFGDAARRMIAGKRTANTREAYSGALGAHLGAFAGRKLRDVANDRDGVKALTVNHPQGRRLLAVLRETCQEAVDAGRLSGHRLHGLKCNHAPGKRDIIIATPEQVNVIAEAMGPDGLAVRIMRGTGMRVGEVLVLEKKDFMTSVDGGVIVHVSRQHTEEGTLKHRQDFAGRDVPVARSLAALVSERPDGRLFSVKYRTFLARFTKAAKAAGLPPEFTPHQLRHGFASALLPAGVAITDVARWMGDEVRTVANVYAHLMPGQAERARDLLEQDYRIQDKSERAA